jgi:tetratricopeptide (TPR) repeat protein
MRTRRRVIACLGVALALSAVLPRTPLVAQQPREAREAAERAVPLYDGLGTYSRRITTRVPLAQQYFDQGMRLTYGFGLESAQQSFRAAIAADSSCAMCWWGLAWALGPYINGPSIDSTDAVEAHRAAQRAKTLASSVPAADRALIEAMTVRYQEVPVRAQRKALDSAYANAMRDVVRRFPNDLDAGSLLGESLMVLRPWDHWTRAGDPQPGTEEVIAVLESVLRRDLRHPGACHHYIHATEASRTPERAAACADVLADIIPGASHIPHMPSHTYMRMGRYADAVRFNQRAWMADQRARHDGAPGIYPTHNLDMLRSAASMDGQSGVALQAARDMGAGMPFPNFAQWLTQVRFGRWDEILASPLNYDDELSGALSAFAKGMALLGTGKGEEAAWQLTILDALRGAIPDSAMFGEDPIVRVLGVAREVLAGEIAGSKQQWDDAVRALRTAVAHEDSLRYNEPEFWPLPARQYLGAVQLEAGRAADAEQTYRDELKVHPANGWSLFGLTQALRAQGKLTEAEETSRAFGAAWARADVWLTSSRMKPAPPPRATTAPTP